MEKLAKSSRSWTIRIQDILKCINQVSLYLINVTYSEFCQNKMLIDAVIRNIEIIGEASRHIPSTIKNLYPDIPWHQMGGMRNFIAHEYFLVEENVVWTTAINHLPELKKQLERISIHEKNSH